MRSIILTFVAIGCASGQFRSSDMAKRSSREANVVVQIDDIQPVKAGEAFEFGFWSENASYCTIQPGGKKLLVKIERSYYKVKVPGSRAVQTVKVICVGPDGQAQDSKQVTVNSPQSHPPEVKSLLLSLTATFPQQVADGAPAPISYTVKDAVRCDVFGTTAASAADGTYDVSIANLYADFNGTIICYDKDGKSKTVEVKIDAVLTPAIPDNTPPRLSLTANYPSQVLKGAAAIVKYSTRNATSCNAFSENNAAHNDGEHIVNLNNMQSDFTGTIQCSGASGQSSQVSVTIKIIYPPVSVTLGIPNPNPVASGGDVVVPFTIVNAVSCWIMNDVSRVISPTATSYTLQNVTSDTTFSLTCSGESGQPITKSTAIQLEAPSNDLVLTLDDAPEVFYDKAARLSYTVQNATTCSWKIDNGAYTESGAASGSQTFQVLLKQDSIVTVTCENDVPQQLSRSKPVTVQAVVDSPSLQFPPQNFYFLFVLDNSASMSAVATKMAAAMNSYIRCQGQPVSSSCPFGSVFPTLMNVETHLGVINTQLRTFAPKDGAKLEKEFVSLASRQENVSRVHISYSDDLLYNKDPYFAQFLIDYDVDVEYPGISGQPGFGDLVHYQVWNVFKGKVQPMVNKLATVRSSIYAERTAVTNRIGTSRERSDDKAKKKKLNDMFDRIKRTDSNGTERGELPSLSSVDANLSKPPCTYKWFKPADKSSSQDYCFVAALQIAGTASRAEPGIMAFDQLIDRYDNQNIPLFESGVVANVVFVSDTQDPGSWSLATDSSGSLFLDGAKASKVTVGGATMSYTDYLLQRKTASYFFNRAKDNSQVSSLTFHGIVPKDKTCPGSDEPFGALTYQKLIADSGGKIVDMCTAGDDMLNSLQDIFASTRFVTKTYNSRLVIKNIVSIKEKGTGNLLTNFQISADGKTLTVNHVDVLNSPGLDISAVCYKGVLTDVSCSFTSGG